MLSANVAAWSAFQHQISLVRVRKIAVVGKAVVTFPTCWMVAIPLASMALSSFLEDLKM